MARQRRHNRPRKAKGRFRGLYQVLAVAAILAAVTAACVVFFRVKTVTVEGGQRYTQEEIAQVSGVREGDYLILLNRTRIQRKIRAELPYIEQVAVRWILPDTVAISVEECAVAAALQCQGQWWLVNSAGKLLEAVSAAQAQSFPVLTGVILLSPEAGRQALVSEEEQNRWSCALELLSALEERGELSRLDNLDCGSAGAFTLQYDQRYTILFPTTIEFEYVTQERFSYFLTLLEEALPQLQEEGQDIVDFTLWESTGWIYARRSK